MAYYVINHDLANSIIHTRGHAIQKQVGENMLDF